MLPALLHHPAARTASWACKCCVLMRSPPENKNRHTQLLHVLLCLNVFLYSKNVTTLILVSTARLKLQICDKNVYKHLPRLHMYKLRRYNLVDGLYGGLHEFNRHRRRNMTLALCTL